MRAGVRMDAKSNSWKLGGFYGLVLLVFSDAVDDGTRYLDRKELDVTYIAGNATVNNRNCDLLNTCNSACSRVVCNPVKGGLEALNCTAVDRNEYCGIGNGSNTSCNFMKLDYTIPFVTLPAPGDVSKVQPEVSRDICFQRALLPTFKTVSVQSEYSLTYVGSISGVFQAFPGRENNDYQCSNFDPRKRPWFVDGITVSKEVKILIDASNSMATRVGAEYQQEPTFTYLKVAQNITLEILQTFAAGDNVELISFDSLGATSLPGGPVTFQPYDSFDPSGRPELPPLAKSVGNLAASKEVAPSNLNDAIVKAVSSFPSKTTFNTLKVIIVLSNGLFLPLNSTTFPSTLLKSNKVKLMVYKLPQSNADNADPFLTKTTLRENVCSVFGSFEVLEAQATKNPLYAMRSYFTYLARIQMIAVGNHCSWSNKYKSFSQQLNAITVTIPVFESEDGLLIGVAAIDVAIDDLQPQLKNLVLSNFNNRTNGVQQAPTTFPMTCSYQNATRVQGCEGSPALDKVICEKSDTSTLQERTCCPGYCGFRPRNDGGFPTSAKIGVGVGVPVIFAAIVAFCCWKHRCRGNGGSNTEIGDIPENFRFPGDSAPQSATTTAQVGVPETAQAGAPMESKRSP